MVLKQKLIYEQEEKPMVKPKIVKSKKKKELIQQRREYLIKSTFKLPGIFSTLIFEI